MMRKWNTQKIVLIIGIALLFLISPIILNFILGLETPKIIDIVGDSTDWLSFYGSYFGALIAASISFFILYKTIDHNRKSAELSRKQVEIDKLAERLGECISLFNFNLIANNGIPYEKMDSFHIQIEKLEEYYFEIDKMSKRLKLYYSVNKSDESHSFFSNLKKCVELFQEYISKVISILRDMPNYLTEEIVIEIRNDIDRMNRNIFEKDFDKMSTYKSKLDSISYRKTQLNIINSLIYTYPEKQKLILNPLFESAMTWIENEKKQLKQIKL